MPKSRTRYCQWCGSFPSNPQPWRCRWADIHAACSSLSGLWFHSALIFSASLVGVYWHSMMSRRRIRSLWVKSTWQGRIWRGMVWTSTDWCYIPQKLRHGPRAYKMHLHSTQCSKLSPWMCRTEILSRLRSTDLKILWCRVLWRYCSSFHQLLDPATTFWVLSPFAPRYRTHFYHSAPYFSIQKAGAIRLNDWSKWISCFNLSPPASSPLTSSLYSWIPWSQQEPYQTTPPVLDRHPRNLLRPHSNRPNLRSPPHCLAFPALAYSLPFRSPYPLHSYARASASPPTPRLLPCTSPTHSGRTHSYSSYRALQGELLPSLCEHEQQRGWQVGNRRQFSLQVEWRALNECVGLLRGDRVP